jgi:hypothetical protein
MEKKLELEKILEQNPHIDSEMLKQAMEMVEKLKEYGAKGSRYKLVSPYARRRIIIANSNKKNEQEIRRSRRTMI